MGGNLAKLCGTDTAQKPSEDKEPSEEKKTSEEKEPSEEKKPSEEKQSTFKGEEEWKDENGKTCLRLYAEKLSIIWGDDERYWRWPFMNIRLRDTTKTTIKVAELLKVCWLEVSGNVEMKRLSPGTSYWVSFEIMLKDPAYGWEYPVTFRLKDRNGETLQERKENFMAKPRSEWMNITVGEFTTADEAPKPDANPTIKFELTGQEGGRWKRGLVIKAVEIIALDKLSKNYL